MQENTMDGHAMEENAMAGSTSEVDVKPAPAEAYSARQVIVMRRDLKMRKGKIAAQAGHGCVNATLCALADAGLLPHARIDGDTGWITLDEEGQELARTAAPALAEWLELGTAKICLYVDSEEELLTLSHQLDQAGIGNTLVQDSGRTEFRGVPTYTCLVTWPAWKDELDPITGALPLY